MGLHRLSTGTAHSPPGTRQQGTMARASSCSRSKDSSSRLKKWRKGREIAGIRLERGTGRDSGRLSRCTNIHIEDPEGGERPRAESTRVGGPRVTT